MATISAVGLGVRHAISRTLATANLSPSEATFRVLQSRVWTDRIGRVIRAEATLSVVAPQPIGEWAPHHLLGMVNPDGEHPLMARVPADRPFFLDIFPVTWDRWLRRFDDDLPPCIDPLCPRTGVEHKRAEAFAKNVGKRLPTAAEFHFAWGDRRFPWGDGPHPQMGRVRPPRFDEIPEVGLYPPNENGLYDMGAWLWHWTHDGTLSGGSEETPSCVNAEPNESIIPFGFRLAQDG